MPEQDLPQRLLAEARRGRLVVFLGGEGIGPEAEDKLPALPAGLWLTERTPAGAPHQYPAADLETGEVTAFPAGSVVFVDGVERLGTARQPARLRDWIADILHRRTVLMIGSGPLIAAASRLAEHDLGRRHFAVGGERAAAWIDALAGHAKGVVPKPAPPPPGIPSRLGLTAVAVAGLVAIFSWLLLYVYYGGAQNWRGLRLVPWVAAALAALIPLLPFLSGVVSGRNLPASESGARLLARWSRPPREPLLAVAFLACAAGAWWLGARYVPATFLVIYEAAGVTANGLHAGDCKAEDPCTLIVPRAAHLHFDAAEGACAMDLDATDSLILIDLQDEACEVQSDTDDQQKTNPRGS